MPYSVGAPGMGTLSLLASGPGGSATGNYGVPIVSYGVAVTPDGGTATTRTPNTGGYSESFTIQNTGSANNTFSFTCNGATGVNCGTVPAPADLGANGGQTNVSMPYSLGSPGTGTLTLTATATGASDAGSYSIPISVTLSSVGTDGRFAKDGRFLLQETVNAYDVGRFAQVTNARGNVTTYQYGGNGNNAFLIKITQTHDATGTVDLVTDIAYDGH